MKKQQGKKRDRDKDSKEGNDINNVRMERRSSSTTPTAESGRKRTEERRTTERSVKKRRGSKYSTPSMMPHADRRRTRGMSLMPSAFFTTDFFSPLALAGDFLRSNEQHDDDDDIEPLTQTQIDDGGEYNDSDEDENEGEKSPLSSSLSKNREEDNDERVDKQIDKSSDKTSTREQLDGEEEEEENEGEIEATARSNRRQSLQSNVSGIDFDELLRPLTPIPNEHKQENRRSLTPIPNEHKQGNIRKNFVANIYASSTRIYEAAKNRFLPDTTHQEKDDTTHQEKDDTTHQEKAHQVDNIKTFEPELIFMLPEEGLEENTEEDIIHYQASRYAPQQIDEYEDDEENDNNQLPLRIAMCPVNIDLNSSQYIVDYNSAPGLQIYNQSHANSIALLIDSLLIYLEEKTDYTLDRNLEILLVDQVFDDGKGMSFDDKLFQVGDDEKKKSKKSRRLSGGRHHHPNIRWNHMDLYIEKHENGYNKLSYFDANFSNSSSKKLKDKIRIRTVHGSITDLGKYPIGPIDMIVNPCNWKFKSSGGKLNTLINTAIGPDLETFSKEIYKKGGKKGEVYPVELPPDNHFRSHCGVRYVLQVCLWDFSSVKDEQIDGKTVLHASFIKDIYDKIFKEALDILTKSKLQIPPTIETDEYQSKPEKEPEAPAIISRNKFPPYEHPSKYGLSAPKLSYHPPSFAPILDYVQRTEENGQSNKHAYSSYHYFKNIKNGKPPPNPNIDDSVLYDPWIYYKNENVIVIYDGYPKAKRHLLIIPRPSFLKVTKIEHVKPHHLEKLQYIHMLGYKLMKEVIDPELFPKYYISTNYDEGVPNSQNLGVNFTKREPIQEINYNAICGYHCQPSLLPLHLHCVSYDLYSPHIKNKEHYNSFGTSFFLSADNIEGALLHWSDNLKNYNNTGDLERNKVFNKIYTNLLKLAIDHCKKFKKVDLRCHRCSKCSMNRRLDVFQDHLEKCIVVNETIPTSTSP